jgi:hypothetical protein
MQLTEKQYTRGVVANLQIFVERWSLLWKNFVVSPAPELWQLF